MTTPRPHLSRNVPAWVGIASLRVKSMVTYRFNTFTLLFIVVVQVFILQKLWTALYEGAPGELPLHSLLVYLTIANLQSWVLEDRVFGSYLYGRIREGQIIFDLMRPTGFISQMCAQLFGAGAAAIGFALVSLPLLALVGTVGGPASRSAFGLYLVSLVLAWVIAALLTLMVGMAAFWTTEIGGFAILYHLINQFLAGALVPLVFFPGWLRTVAEILPFQATTYTPVAIYIGAVQGTKAWWSILVQVLWAFILGLCVRWLWARALRRVVVQGG